jgi:hypothetical protein
MKRWIMSASLFVCSIASACPMCKDSIPNGDTNANQDGSLPGGFNNSVYFILLGLFATIGLVSFNLIKSIRNTDKRFTGSQSSRGFEVRPSGSSQDETE